MIELGFASAIVPNMDYEAPLWDFADIMFTPKIFGLKETAAAALGGFPFAKKDRRPAVRTFREYL